MLAQSRRLRTAGATLAVLPSCIVLSTALLRSAGAEIAKQARPGLLILYHRANPGGVGRPNPAEALLQEVQREYRGKVVTGHDLDVF